jgi:hypothetical protein
VLEVLVAPIQDHRLLDPLSLGGRDGCLRVECETKANSAFKIGYIAPEKIFQTVPLAAPADCLRHVDTTKGLVLLPRSEAIVTDLASVVSVQARVEDPRRCVEGLGEGDCTGATASA